MERETIPRRTAHDENKCTNLSAIVVDASNPAYQSVDGVLFNKDQTSLLQFPEGKSGTYTIPNTVTSIGAWAFLHCTRLTSITIPDSVTSIGNAAFFGCKGLTSFMISNSLTCIGDSAFSGCTSLTSFKIPDSVTRIGMHAFSGCTSLREVHIGNSSTHIGSEAFGGCPQLATVQLGSSVRRVEELSDPYVEGRSAARDALLRGCPGQLLTPGNGDYICGIDTHTGLPIRLTGDVVYDHMRKWQRGYHEGLRDFIQEHGLPWNSRLPWLREIQEPSHYFADRFQAGKLIHLLPGGAAAQSKDSKTHISLAERWTRCSRELLLRVTSTKFWPRERFSMESTFVPTSLPVLGQEWTEQPITREISLWKYDRAERIDLIWGPEGSELAFFRFGYAQHSACELQEMFGILDLHLGEWLR